MRDWELIAHTEFLHISISSQACDRDPSGRESWPSLLPHDRRSPGGEDRQGGAACSGSEQGQGGSRDMPCLHRATVVSSQCEEHATWKIALDSPPNHIKIFCPSFELIRAVKNSFLVTSWDIATILCTLAQKGSQKVSPRRRNLPCRKNSAKFHEVSFLRRVKVEKKQANKISVVGITRRCNIVTLHCPFIWISYLECWCYR